MSNSRPAKPNSWKHHGYGKRPRTSQLVPGLRGFLCTCNSQQREKDCVRDAYNLLNLYADKLNEQLTKPEEPVAEPTDDVDSSLTAELNALKEEKSGKWELRFQAIESGAKGVVFIKTTLPDPGKIVSEIVNDMYVNQTQQSKTILRLLPIEATCKAYLDEITKTTEMIFPKHFAEGNQTFSIIFTHRNNNSLVKDDVIAALAAQITGLNDSNKVNLTAPDKVVLVEVMKGICCLAVVADYHKMKKYNLLELCVKDKPEDEKPVEDSPVV